MSKFIKLTEVVVSCDVEATVVCNSEDIFKVVETIDCGSHLTLVKGKSTASLLVTETPEQILKLIEGE